MDLIEVSPGAGPRHPWEEARFDFFFRVLARYIDLPATRSVLDVGAGDAWFAGQLRQLITTERITCWDSGYTDDEVSARGRFPRNDDGIEYVASRPAGTFDLLLFLDVLEHIEDDGEFLALTVRENLAPGGHVLVSVPAWPHLFSSHDVRLRHHRRYAPVAARTLLERAGLEILSSAGLFHSLVVIRLLQIGRERLGGRLAPPPDLGDWRAPAPVTALVRGALKCDAWFSFAASRVGRSLPGLSWWALCRKRPTDRPSAASRVIPEGR
jgi:SAM-dependent methyltransferase